MKKIIIIYLFLLLLQSCGYAPMYANNQKVDFYIEEIRFDDGDRDLSTYLKKNLNSYFVIKGNKKYKIDTSINYIKNSVSKDSKGDTVEYELIAIVRFVITNEKFNKELVIRESLKMNNFSDEFEERQYEKTIKQNMARSISSKLLTQISRFNVN
jgi:PBP1b-binding outer membrane lipoprotein LpoB